MLSICCPFTVDIEASHGQTYGHRILPDPMVANSPGLWPHGHVTCCLNYKKKKTNPRSRNTVQEDQERSRSGRKLDLNQSVGRSPPVSQILRLNCPTTNLPFWAIHCSSFDLFKPTCLMILMRSSGGVSSASQCRRLVVRASCFADVALPAEPVPRQQIGHLSQQCSNSEK